MNFTFKDNSTFVDIIVKTKDGLCIRPATRLYEYLFVNGNGDYTKLEKNIFFIINDEKYQINGILDLMGLGIEENSSISFQVSDTDDISVKIATDVHDALSNPNNLWDNTFLFERKPQLQIYYDKLYSKNTPQKIIPFIQQYSKETITWFNTTNLLPKQNYGSILICDSDNCYSLAVFKNNQWFDPYNNPIKNVTHWTEFKGPN